VIDGLSPIDAAWLSAFFAAPNELTWSALSTGAAPQPLAERVLPWLQLLASPNNQAPILLPFVRDREIAGWYATTQAVQGANELGAEIEAWLGPSYLSVFQLVRNGSGDPMASAMQTRFGGTVWRFTGPDPTTNAQIASRVAQYAALLIRRPPTRRRTLRPVGSIRADFDRALLAQDESGAEAMIAELRATGRLNEENLRYLDVRMKAGLGLWPHIARDHWLVTTLADLELPPQTLADVIEALYRTYVDDLEPAGNLPALLAAFDRDVAKRYPRLFASRHGLRSPRVIKAFLLFECLQGRPDAQILAHLTSMLPDGERQAPFIAALLCSTQAAQLPELSEADAEDAFDDGQYDRAFEFFLALPLTRKAIGRMVSCALFIGTDEAKQRLRLAIAKAAPALIASLPPVLQDKLADISSVTPEIDAVPAHPPSIGGWMQWADQLARGESLSAAEAAVRDAASQWEITPFGANETQSQAFATILGNLSGEAAALVQRALPQIFTAFFPQGSEVPAGTKPIAAMLFVLIALDDAQTRASLDLLAQLLVRLLEFGLSGADYESMIADLEDVQRRVGSYGHLPWSLDICELLAIAPSPSDQAREARLRLFLLILGQVQGFAHRLHAQDLVPIEYLARDYGVEQQRLDGLKHDGDTTANAPTRFDLVGKTVGIYTLAEAAGTRAQQALLKMFPGCKVVVNSDLVCTAQLAGLARAADVFVFAWKSSSHQAFYCVKEALTKCELIWAPGKGTASILRAVSDSLEND